MENYQMTNNIETLTQPKPPMKWFKFLIYFGLFAGALLNLSQGIQYINGDIYKLQVGVSFKAIYEACPALEVIDIIMGCLCILVAILQIVSRFLLAKYKDSGIKLLYTLYILSIVGLLFYSVSSYSIYPITFIDPHYHFINVEKTLEYDIFRVIPSIAAQVVMLIVNIKYFSRAERNMLFSF